MSHGHGFDAVGDELTACQAVLHTDVAHGYTIAYADGRDLYRRSAGHSDAGFYGFRHLIQVYVAGNDLAFG